jgi:NF-kappa-B inhibitor-interacting Ras-like protein
MVCAYLSVLINFQPFPSTIEDIYEANIDTDRGTKEILRFYDTQGIEFSSPSIKEDLPKHLFALADAYIIVYSIDDEASFQVAEAIRKEIEKQTREKKETVVVLLGNKCDLLAKRKVDSVQALNWASRERF